MLPQEYAGYLAYFLPDYALEITANYDLSPTDALAQAKQEIATDLPDGVDTDGQVLLSILDRDEGLVGYLWYKPDLPTKSAFIYDFHILPGLQGKGLGKAALKALDALLLAQGITQIGLRVAADNVRAQRLYRTVGFRVTGVNMIRRIG
jgi:ribosomal protein S18 acetylase RimI-like enzyme